MAKKITSVSASAIETFTIDSVSGKKTAVAKIKIPTMSIESGSEKLSELLQKAVEKTGATTMRGTLTLYTSAE